MCETDQLPISASSESEATVCAPWTSSQAPRAVPVMLNGVKHLLPGQRRLSPARTLLRQEMLRKLTMTPELVPQLLILPPVKPANVYR